MLCYNILDCEGVNSCKGGLSGRYSSVTARVEPLLFSKATTPSHCAAQLHEARRDRPFFRETLFRSEMNSRWIMEAFEGELGPAF